ncbi:histidine kinase [Schaalia sp. HMT-877]|nr:histidine kinase [Schaalia sp. HMT-877]
MGGGGRSGRGRWDWVPVAVCACYGAAVLASVLVPGFPAGPAVPQGLGAAATALAAAASAGGLACVAVRRARPATAALIAVGSYAASTAHGAGALLVLPAVICLYSLGRHAPSRAAAPVGAVCAAATGLGGAAGASGSRGAEALASFTTFALVCCCGMVLRARERARETQRRGREAALRAASLEQERNLALAQSRVAAELHDSVGHGLTTIIVLSEGLTGATGDAEVDEALAGINAAARECLEQTREAVRALGRGGGAAAGPGRHTWDDVHSVIASARSTGMAVAFHETGRRSPDEGQADLAFAVAREGITNALRHARGASVITVSWDHMDDGWVEASVRDDGRKEAPGSGADGRAPGGNGRKGARGDGGEDGGPPPIAPPHSGLSMVRARVVEAGGACEAGWSGSGWALHARIPPGPGALGDADGKAAEADAGTGAAAGTAAEARPEAESGTGAGTSAGSRVGTTVRTDAEAGPGAESGTDAEAGTGAGR